MFFFFFFSSRRRHTRLQGDWSSDVCSSDLHIIARLSRPFSLLDDSAVAAPDFSPATVQVVSPRGEGELGGRLLIHLDAPAGLLADPQVAVLHHRAALENLLRAVVEGRVLLNAEVEAG